MRHFDNAEQSLSARRAWIEMVRFSLQLRNIKVALRKESVDRNTFATAEKVLKEVALRKESVDRNHHISNSTSLV